MNFDYRKLDRASKNRPSDGSFLDEAVFQSVRIAGHLNFGNCTVLDAMIEKDSPADVVNLVKGCEVLYRHIVSKNPDIVFFPLRGAAPLQWILEVIGYEEAGKSFPCAMLPVGTFLSQDGKGELHGIRHEEKEQIICQIALSTCRLGRVSRAMIIDEVQSGSTCSQTARLLARYLQKFHRGQQPLSVHIIGARDTLTSGIANPRDGRGNDRAQTPKRSLVRSYVQIFSGQIEGVTLEEVRMPLFFVDRERFLDVMFIANGHKPGEAIDKIYLVPNEEARRLFLALTYAVRHPSILQAVLEEKGIPAGGAVAHGSGHIYDFLSEILGKGRCFTSSDGDALETCRTQTSTWLGGLYEEAVRAG